MLAASSSMPTVWCVRRAFAAEGTNLFKGISRIAFIVFLLRYNAHGKHRACFPGARERAEERGARDGAQGRGARASGADRGETIIGTRPALRGRSPAVRTGGPRGGERARRSFPDVRSMLVEQSGS